MRRGDPPFKAGGDAPPKAFLPSICRPHMPDLRRGERGTCRFLAFRSEVEHWEKTLANISEAQSELDVGLRRDAKGRWFRAFIRICVCVSVFFCVQQPTKTKNDNKHSQHLRATYVRITGALSARNFLIREAIKSASFQLAGHRSHPVGAEELDAPQAAADGLQRLKRLNHGWFSRETKGNRVLAVWMFFSVETSKDYRECSVIAVARFILQAVRSSSPCRPIACISKM